MAGDIHASAKEAICERMGGREHGESEVYQLGKALSAIGSCHRGVRNDRRSHQTNDICRHLRFIIPLAGAQ